MPSAVGQRFYRQFVSQTIPAGGLSERFGFEYMINCAFVVGSGGAANLILTDGMGVAKPYLIRAGTPLKIENALAASYSITGTGTTIVGEMAYPDYPDPNSLVVTGGTANVAITNVVSTDLGQGTAPLLVPVTGGSAVPVKTET